jgi:hypothetical protein
VNDVSSNADSPFVVLVTEREVILLEFEMSLNEYTQVGEKWTPGDLNTVNPREIVAASVNPSQIVLGLSGVVLVLLHLSDNDKLCRVRQAFLFFRYSLSTQTTCALHPTATAILPMLAKPKSPQSRAHLRILPTTFPILFPCLSGELIVSRYIQSSVLNRNCGCDAKRLRSRLFHAPFCYTSFRLVVLSLKTVRVRTPTCL